MRRVDAHIGNRENHNNGTEFKKNAMIFDLWKGEQHSLSVSHSLQGSWAFYPILYCVWGIKELFHYIEYYSPSLELKEKENPAALSLPGFKWDMLR